MSRQIELAVLETAEWYGNDRITTVRPMFQILMQQLSGNPNDFHYATFIGPDSLVETLEKLADKRGVQYIYIGTHGEDDNIVRPMSRESDRKIQMGTLAKCLTKYKKNLTGVFLGGCQLKYLAEYLSEELAAVQHKNAPKPWVAGYGDFIPWMGSAMFDMVFLHHALKLERSTQIGMVDIFDELHHKGYKGIMKNLDFDVYISGKSIKDKTKGR